MEASKKNPIVKDAISFDIMKNGIKRLNKNCPAVGIHVQVDLPSCVDPDASEKILSDIGEGVEHALKHYGEDDSEQSS